METNLSNYFSSTFTSQHLFIFLVMSSYIKRIRAADTSYKFAKRRTRWASLVTGAAC